MGREPGARTRQVRTEIEAPQATAEDHVRGMLAADAAFEADFPDLPVDVRRAQAARRRSLERALAYGEIIRRLKAGDVVDISVTEIGTLSNRVVDEA